jgi:hypothetical protein
MIEVNRFYKRADLHRDELVKTTTNRKNGELSVKSNH